MIYWNERGFFDRVSCGVGEVGEAVLSVACTETVRADPDGNTCNAHVSWSFGEFLSESACVGIIHSIIL